MLGSGSLEVITGPMFSGKTEELVRRLHRAEYAFIKPVVFKPKIDTRYRTNEIMSHSGYVFRAHPIEEPIEALAFDSELIAFDEAQFFNLDLFIVVNTLLDRGTSVLVVGLDKDYRGEPFGPMPEILAIADHVSKLTAVCVQCHDDATMTFRRVAETDTIVVGGSESYEARCRNCYKLG